MENPYEKLIAQEQQAQEERRQDEPRMIEEIRREARIATKALRKAGKAAPAIRCQSENPISGWALGIPQADRWEPFDSRSYSDPLPANRYGFILAENGEILAYHTMSNTPPSSPYFGVLKTWKASDRELLQGSIHEVQILTKRDPITQEWISLIQKTVMSAVK